MTKKRKRIIAALMCMGLMTAAAVPAALAERNGSNGKTGAGQITEITAPAEETNGERAERPECGRGHGRHGRPEEAAEPENAIGKDAAKEAALADAGIAAEQAEKLRARVSDKDGAAVYRVSFGYDGQKYSYRIDPLTGEILDKTIAEAAANETHGHGRHGRPEEAAEPENAIGKDAAKEAALADAGITAEQAEKLRARVSDKDGTAVYRVSFGYEGQRYSYKIDPLTGGILDKTVAEAAHEESGTHGRHGGGRTEEAPQEAPAA